MAFHRRIVHQTTRRHASVVEVEVECDEDGPLRAGGTTTVRCDTEMLDRRYVQGKCACM